MISIWFIPLVYFVAFIHGGRRTLRLVASDLGDPQFIPPSWPTVARRLTHFWRYW